MKRLMLWNILLAVCATAGVYQLRRQWMETRAQEQVILLRKPAPPKPDAAPLPAKPAPFQAASYVDVAQKTLFSKDRNPTVEIPVPPPPPPPPPMPALPHLFGVMGLPSGPIAIMSEKSGAPQKRVREGDDIGEFKVTKLGLQKITMQWKDKTIEKSVDELLDHTAPVAAAAEAPHPTPSAPPTPPPANTAAVPAQFGVEIGAPGHSVHACKMDGSDPSPAGTVVEGYKKTIEKTPFGDACRWIQQ